MEEPRNIQEEMSRLSAANAEQQEQLQRLEMELQRARAERDAALMQLLETEQELAKLSAAS